MSQDFSKYLNTSVDDLRSTLKCELANLKAEEAPEKITFYIGLKDACPSRNKTMLAVIERHLRALHKLSQPAATAPEQSRNESGPSAFTRFGGQLEARAPEGALVAAEEDEDAVLGLQLEMQFERVCGNREDDLRFGAMMLKLRARNLTQHAESSSPKKGRYESGGGMKAWLKKYAPKVGEAIAYQLMDLAEGVIEELKLGKKYDLEELLSAQLADLPERLAKKREAVDALINGKSRRALQIGLGLAEKTDGRKKNPGGYRPNALFLRAWLEEEYPEQPELLEIDTFTKLPPEIQKRFRAEGERYEQRLTDDQRKEIEEAADARAWNTQIVPAITLGIDRGFFHRSADLQPLLTAIDDLRALVLQADQARAGKRSKKAIA